MRLLTGLRVRLGFQQHALRGFHALNEFAEIAEAAGFGVELCDLAFDIGDVLIDPREAVAMGADVGFELVALGREVGQRCGQFGEGALGGGERRFRLGHAFIRAAALVDARLDFVLENGVFGFEACQRDVSIRQLALFALDVGGELRQAAIEFGDALLGAGFLAVEHFARVGQPLQSGGGARFVFTQARQFGGADRLDACGFRLLEGAFGLLAHVQIMGLACVGDVGMGLQPTQVEQQRLGLADLGGDFAVADRLTCLLLQAIDLTGELADDVLDAGEIGFGSLEAQFGFMAAGMQSGDAGGVFQHAAALVGTRLNDLADLALVDEGGRSRTCGGIREQNLHVTRAHILAIDAINRACFALDPARDFQHLLIVHGGGRRAIGVVDGHRHFGVVACRAVAGTGEDHGVHVGGTQRLVRSFAHRPAQGFDQVRFAAAVGTDNAGEARLDQKICRFNE